MAVVHKETFFLISNSNFTCPQPSTCARGYPHEGNILMVSSRIFLPWYWIYLRWSRVYRSFPVVKVFHRSSKISAALFQNHIIHVFIIRRLTWFAVNSKILHEYGLEITTNHWWLHHGCWRWHDFLHFLLAAK